jgi:hypothetical protein
MKQTGNNGRRKRGMKFNLYVVCNEIFSGGHYVMAYLARLFISGIHRAEW